MRQFGTFGMSCGAGGVDNDCIVSFLSLISFKSERLIFYELPKSPESLNS